MPRFTPFACYGAALLAAAFVTSPAQSAEKDKPQKLVTLDPSQVDAAYDYQGEYMGYVAEQAHSPYVKKIGIQVITRGPETFEAVVFAGGLPGDGWNKKDRQKYPATVENGVVKVAAGNYALSVADNIAVVADAQGRQLGQLRKYDRQSPTMGLQPPADALVLFDGKKNDLWKNMKVTEDGLLEEGCETVDTFRDFHMHLEFQLPYKPEGVGQDRGNSGVYLQRRYEVQVLDSFGEPGLPNECGGIYKLHSPDQNMCLPPLAWQTYDIDFRMARFDEEGNKTENMKIRVRHNGILIHDDLEVESKTGAGKAETDEGLPLLLQDHGNPVRYRNIWLVEKDPFANEPETEVQPLLAGGYHYGHGGYYRHGSYVPPGYWNYRTSYHNYGPVPGYPQPYWYSSSFVDLPAFPYYGGGTWGW